MSTDGAEITSSEQWDSLDELRGLLEKQLELAHQGVSTGEEFNALAAKATCIVGKLSQSKILKTVEFKNQHDQLRKLYALLRLTLTAQQAETVKELRHIRKGRKTIEAYRNNL